MSSYAEPQQELTPQQEQQLQKQGLTAQKMQQQDQTPNATASPSLQLQQQQGLTPNATASPSLQLQQQQDPPITFEGGEEEPCDGVYFVGPGGVTECM